MIETFNSFYGNRHTRRSPLSEALRDVFRRHHLKNVYDVLFFTPEVRGLNYEDRENPKAGGFQVVVRLSQFPTYQPRWSVSLQQKSYASLLDVPDKKATSTLVSDTEIADKLTTQEAFHKAMVVYSIMRWNNNDARLGYTYSEHIFEDVPPLPLDGERTRPAVSILSMPAYETLRQGTHRLEEERTSVLNRLSEQRGYMPGLIVT